MLCNPRVNVDSTQVSSMNKMQFLTCNSKQAFAHSCHVLFCPDYISACLFSSSSTAQQIHTDSPTEFFFWGQEMNSEISGFRDHTVHKVSTQEIIPVQSEQALDNERIFYCVFKMDK